MERSDLGGERVFWKSETREEAWGASLHPNLARQHSGEQGTLKLRPS